MSFSFLSELSESTLFPSKKSLEKYDINELKDLGYLYIIALHIMINESYTKKWAQNYCRKASITSNYKKWRSDGNDLFILMHAIDNDDSTYTKTLYRWLVSDATKEKEDETKRLFVKLDNIFSIRNSSMRAIRRLAQDWGNIPIKDQKMTMTRLLQMFRSKAPKSDILSQLNKLADIRHLELFNVNNPEEDSDDFHKEPKKDNFLLSLASMGVGGLIGAAVAKSLRKESVDEGEVINIKDIKKKEKPESFDQDNLPHKEKADVNYFPPRYRVIIWDKDEEGNRNIYDILEFNYNESLEDCKNHIKEWFPRAQDKEKTYQVYRRGLGWTTIDGYDPKFKNKNESASSGGTCAASIATSISGNAAGSIGVGFSNDYSKSVYPAPKKEKKKKVLSRLTESTLTYPTEPGTIAKVVKKPIITNKFDELPDGAEVIDKLDGKEGIIVSTGTYKHSDAFPFALVKINDNFYKIALMFLQFVKKGNEVPNVDYDKDKIIYNKNRRYSKFVKTFYHVTYSSNISKIMEEGLKPQIGERSIIANERRELVYLFKSLSDVEDALLNWLGEHTNENEKICLFKVLLPKTFKTHPRLLEFGYEYTVDKTIPPEYLKLVTDDLDNFVFPEE